MGPRQTCQMFETRLVERFSRIHPATPFVFWLPVIAYVEFWALRSGLAVLPAIGLLFVGALFWSLAEYLLHRYVFHYVGPRGWQRRMHFIIHGVHHDYPNDADRLVMPLGVSVPMGIAFFALFRLVLGAQFGAAAFVGFALSYLAYDGIHYAVHHRPMKSRIGKWLKRHHMIHHHAGSASRWGVSSPLWDFAFGTIADPTPLATPVDSPVPRDDPGASSVHE